MEAIVVDHVSKVFSLRHNKSLKEAVAHRFRNEPQRDDFTALDDVTFTVNAGEIVGLVGANGSGKSTLLRLISGVMAPEKGSVKVRGSVAGLIGAGAGFVADLTGRENVYLNAAILGLKESEVNSRFDDIVEFADVARFIDTPVKFYSSGMYSRLSFSVAVHTDPDIFLVDEVLAVGDQFFRKKSQEKFDEIRASGRTMVIVSHNLADMERLCTRGIFLRGGVVVADGPIKPVVEAYKASPKR
jgi:ABC-2 type transport system ATP-binding protein